MRLYSCTIYLMRRAPLSSFQEHRALAQERRRLLSQIGNIFRSIQYSDLGAYLPVTEIFIRLMVILYEMEERAGYAGSESCNTHGKKNEQGMGGPRRAVEVEVDLASTSAACARDHHRRYMHRLVPAFATQSNLGF